MCILLSLEQLGNGDACDAEETEFSNKQTNSRGIHLCVCLVHRSAPETKT